ncbi:DUF2180 family protein [Streptomyces sp. M2CJ-2]|nr:DUF2180 family protein [Streptomyces sp. M2CJ-2]MBL3671151.1 DUF2180 family protein [Streptomyces sp. M2CJ-2]
MNCLLCATDNHTTTAVAICHHRGAAVCQDHACYDNTPDTPPA